MSESSGHGSEKSGRGSEKSGHGSEKSEVISDENFKKKRRLQKTAVNLDHEIPTHTTRSTIIF